MADSVAGNLAKLKDKVMTLFGYHPELSKKFEADADSDSDPDTDGFHTPQESLSDTKSAVELPRAQLTQSNSDKLPSHPRASKPMEEANTSFKTLDEATKQKQDFFKYMIGNAHAFQKKSCSLSFLLKVQIDSLDEEAILHAYNRCKQTGNGLAYFLQPFTVDLLKRKLSLDVLSEALVKSHSTSQQAADPLPELVLDLSAKDLFIALLEVTPDRMKSHLALHYVSLGCPLPFFYQMCSFSETERNLRSVTNFHILEDLLYVPRSPLILSCGTAETGKCGKTFLLQKLIADMKDSIVDVNLFDLNDSTSPCHSPSIDLIFDKQYTYADVHGYTNDLAFQRTVTLLATVSSLVLVHISKNDIDRKSKHLLEHTKKFLLDCFTQSAAKNISIAVLVRDLRREDKEWLCEIIQQELTTLFKKNTLNVIGVLNLTDFTSDNRRYHVIKDLHERLKPLLPCSPNSPFPPLEVLQSTFSTLNQKKDVDRIKNVTSLGQKVIETLNRLRRTGGQLASVVFPVTNIKTRIAEAKEEELKIREERAAKTGLYTEKHLADNIAKQKRLRAELLTCTVTEPVQLFAKTIRERNPRRLLEFQHYLEIWKQQDVDKLYKKRLEFYQQIEKLKKDFSESSQSKKSKENTLTNEVKKICTEIDEIDISIDTFWSEIMQLCNAQESRCDETHSDALKSHCDLDPVVARSVYLDCVMDGYPMQLLQGTPLQMAGSFLESVFASFNIDSVKRDELFVVSVIGAQSSAKSTLLNYLFGCGFSTRSGRCTKGLYASYMQTSTGKGLLILDSEGLLSIEGAGRVFDGQITIMAMACSDVVIINHKGEISSELKDLLEVCLNAMDHLKVTSIRPKLAFVLRDQRDRNTNVHATSLQKMKDMLKEAALSSHKDFEDLVDIDNKSVFLLPSAFSEVAKGERSVEVPSTVFSQETFTLRNEIFRLAEKGSSIMTFANPDKETENVLLDWYNHASAVWSTLTKYGHSLLHYKTMQEIRLHKDLTEIYNEVVAIVLEDKGGKAGYKTKARQRVDKFKQVIVTVKDRDGLEKEKSLLVRNLEDLKDWVIAELEGMFKEKTSLKRYDHLRFTFVSKLKTPVQREHELHIYFAQLHVDQKKNVLSMNDIHQYFKDATKEILKKSKYKAGMSRDHAKQLFEEQWTKFEYDFEKRLLKNSRSDEEIQNDTAAVFAEVANSLQFNKEYLILLEKHGSHLLTENDNFQRRPPEAWAKYVKKDATLFEKFVSKMYDAFTRKGQAVETAIFFQVQLEMQNRVAAVTVELRSSLKSQNLDRTVVTIAVEKAVSVVAELEKKFLPDHGFKLNRAEFVNSFYCSLQIAAIKTLKQNQKDQQEEMITKMRTNKEIKNEEFLAIVTSDAGDLGRAKLFAKLYSRSLQTYAEKEILDYRERIRESITDVWGSDEAKAAAHAYQISFGELNYRNVIMYCLDVNRFLKKHFVKRYNAEMQTLLAECCPLLNDFVTQLFSCLHTAAEHWKTASDTHSKPLKVEDFLNFLSEYAAEDSRETGFLERRYRTVCESAFPNQVNYKIGRIDIFVNSFQDALLSKHLPKVRDKLSKDTLPKQLIKERREIWMKLRGCSAQCPLCGAKCEGGPNHSRPHTVAESHHVFPAFGRVSTVDENHPIFDMCLDPDNTHKHRWKLSCETESEWSPNLENFLAKHYDFWLPFLPNPGFSQASDNLKRCWVNCRKALVPRYDMTDKLPEGWEEAYSEPTKEILPEDVEGILKDLKSDD